MTLREQAIRAAGNVMAAGTATPDRVADAVLGVFAEREREQRDETYANGFADGRVAGIKERDARLRERIEALPLVVVGVDYEEFNLDAEQFREDVLGVFYDES